MLGDRPFFFPCVAVLVGAALGPTAAPSIVTLLAAAVLSASALLWAPRPGGHLFLLAACGFMGAGLATLHASVEVPPKTFGAGKIRLGAELEDIRAVEGGSSATLRVWDVGGAPARFRARVFLEGPGAPPPGTELWLRAALRPVQPAANPGEHDRAERWTRSGLVATGNARTEALVQLEAGSAGAAWMAGERARLAKRVAAIAPDEESAALYLTLAAGLRASLGSPL
jgi:competence protein ComEC